MFRLKRFEVNARHHLPILLLGYLRDFSYLLIALNYMLSHLSSDRKNARNVIRQKQKYGRERNTQNRLRKYINPKRQKRL